MQLNNACRIITGNLRPTPLTSVYRLSDIAPPAIRRDTTTRFEKFKQEIDPRHPLFEDVQAITRLKSRKNLMKNESLSLQSAHYRKIESWTERQKREGRLDWENLHRWGLKPTSECPCGHQTQTMEHILMNSKLGPKTTNTSLLECNDTALEWIQEWRDKIR